MNHLDSVDEILQQVKSLSEEQKQTQQIQQEQKAAPQQEPEFQEDVSFALTKEEAYLCLKKAGVFKTTGKRAVIYTVLMAIAAVGFFISWLVGQNVNWLVFACVSLAVIAVIWVVPYIQLNRLAKENAKGDIIKARITKEKITIIGNESSWDIPLNKRSRLSTGDRVLVFHTENKQLFAIPERAIRKEARQTVKELVCSGTIPYEEEKKQKQGGIR